MALFYREDWLHLDTFCRTHPAVKKVLEYLYDHPDREHTVQSVARDSGMAVSFFDLKALFVYKLLSAVDGQGKPITIPWDLTETSRYRLVKEKTPLIRAILEKRQLAWDADDGVIWEEGPNNALVAPPPHPEG